MIRQGLVNTNYDPFVRGSFPVGVQTVYAIDTTRDGRPLTCEIWYPATQRYAGQDLGASLRDTFTVLPGLPAVWQAAVRDALPHPGTYPFIAFSHRSWGHRRQSTFLCTRLASHGYVVATVDYTGNTTMDLVQASRMAASGGDTPERRAARLQAWVAARVPDVQCMLDQLLSGAVGEVAD